MATSAATGLVTYFVTAINSYGPSNSPSVQVNWGAGGGGGGGGGGGPSFCSSYSNVVVTTVAWGDGTRKYTKDMGGFAANGVVVMQFTVPSSPATYGTPGNATMVEYQDPPTFRQATLSKSSCDFRAMDSSGNNGPFAVSYGNLAAVDFNVGTQPVALVPGQTYYVNWRNYSPDLPNGGGSCAGSYCNADFVTVWPK